LKYSAVFVKPDQPYRLGPPMTDQLYVKKGYEERLHLKNVEQGECTGQHQRHYDSSAALVVGHVGDGSECS
jgi:hypothetical protein